jgi:hypothetical protein
MNDDLPQYDRIHELARRAHHERSLYLGEALGHMLVIAWEALGSIGTWVRRSAAARRLS